MEITWYGKSCFSFKDKGVTLVTNPNLAKEAPTADIVLLSQEFKDQKFEGKVLDWPGEYEIKEVQITGLTAWTKSKSKEEEEGSCGDPTTIFYFEMGGIKCCHLGDLGHVLTSDMVNQIGDVDILIVNLSEKGNLDLKKAMEVIEAIEPRAILPMGEGDFTSALKELGAENVEPQEKFTIKSASELPEDKRTYIVLKK